MSVTIKLYKNISEQNRLDKTKYLTGPLTILTGEFRSDVNILSPVVDVELPNNFLNINLNAFNYVRIEEFNRYYFVNSMDVCNGNVDGENKTVLLRLYLQVDVLMSWKDDIKKLECFITRQEVESNKLYIDTKRPFLNKSTVKFIEDNSNVSELFPFDKIPTDEYGRIFCYTVNMSSVAFRGLEGTNVTPFNDYYIVDGTGIRSLVTYLYKTFVGFFQQPSEGFISLHYYPFSIDKILKRESSYEETSVIYIGDKKFDNETTPNTFLIANNRPTASVFNIKGGYVHIPFIRYFYELSPFTTYELYVPYVGWIKLSNNIICDCSGDDLFVNYYVNFVNNEVNYAIYSSINGLNKPYLIGGCNLGCEIPLSSSNNNEVMKKIILGTIGGAIKVGTSIANYSSVNEGFDKMSDKRTNKYKTQKKIMRTEQKGDIINSVTETGINMSLTCQEKIDDIGSLDGSYSYIRFSNKPILKITSTTPATIDLEKYGKLVGFPYIGSETISKISGYTEVGSVHVENINCLEEERDEIESILKSGFIA